jgi:4-amino-4-deoxy-L-arabinose transferase-like glycosyltransferase
LQRKNRQSGRTRGAYETARNLQPPDLTTLRERHPEWPVDQTSDRFGTHAERRLVLSEGTPRFPPLVFRATKPSIAAATVSHVPSRVSSAAPLRPAAARALILIAATVVGVVLTYRAILPSRVFDGWDEAYHALHAVEIADDFRSTHVFSLAYDTWLQLYWPPLHPWLGGLLLALTGPSIVAIRLLSLVAFVAQVLLTFVAGTRLARLEKRAAAVPVCALVAAGSVLLCGGMLTFAPLAMLESVAVLALVVGIIAYLRTIEHPGQWRPAVALGIAIVVVYLTKANYGIVLGLSVAVTWLLDGVGKDWRGHVITGTTATTALAIWLTGPHRFDATLRMLINIPMGPSRWSIDGLLFYPRQLVWVAGSWPLLSFWLVAAASVARSASSGTRLLLVLLTVQFVLAEASVTKLPRHILPVVPAFALIGGVAASRCWAAARRPGAHLALLGAFAALLAAHLTLLHWPSAPLDPERDALARVITDATADGQSSLVLGVLGGERESPAEVDWWLVASGRMPIAGSGALFQHADVVPAVGRRWQRDRWPGTTTWSAYFGLPLDVAPEDTLSATTLNQFLAEPLRLARPARVLLVTPGGGIDERVSEALTALGWVPASPERANRAAEWRPATEFRP